MRARHLLTGAGAGLTAGTLALLTVVPGATAAQPAGSSPQVRPHIAAVDVPARYLGQKLDWKPCGDPGLHTTCAMVTVPRDWNNAYLHNDIEVAVSRVLPKGLKKGQRPARVVFGNPGGPGAPGLGMAPYLASLSGLKNHLAIGFDPRGTGDSTNATCDGAPAYTMDARDRAAENLNLTADASRLISTYCKTRSRGLMPFISTEQTVKDIDLVRQLLGYDVIDYVGYSGGTWMGAYYQKYFPKHVGRFVLDSNTDFTGPWSKTFEAQPQAFERRFREDFGEWAAKYDDVLGLGITPRQVHRFYERLRADLRREPVILDVFGFDVTIDQNTLDGTVLGAMYSKVEFQGLAETMTEFRGLWTEQREGGAQAAEARFAKLSKAHQQAIVRTTRRVIQRPLLGRPVSEDAGDATFYGITCNDTQWPQGQAYGDFVSSQQGWQYPLVGWSLNQNPCAYWNRPSLAMPVPDGAGIPVTLMVQSVHDPATNASLARSAHERYRGSRLITVANEGDHGIYGGVNKCTDKLVDRFLSTGVAPARDLTCLGEGTPAPVKHDGADAGRQDDDKVSADPLSRILRLGETLAGFTD